MLIKKEYFFEKPINIRKIASKYYYDKVRVNRKIYFLFWIIPIFLKDTTVSIDYSYHSYIEPEIQKYY